MESAQSQLNLRVIESVLSNKDTWTLSNCNTPIGGFLYSRKEHVENNLFVKYYVRMANFNKVIKVLNLKSAVNLL